METMRNHTGFDFPCSTTFRSVLSSAPRRPRVPSIGHHSDEQELIDYISVLEAENRDLRLALDVARLAGNLKPADGRSAGPTSQVYEGLDL